MPVPTQWGTTLFSERIDSPRRRTRDGGCLHMSLRMWCNSQAQVGFMWIPAMRNVVCLVLSVQRAGGNSDLNGLIQRQPVEAPRQIPKAGHAVDWSTRSRCVLRTISSMR